MHGSLIHKKVTSQKEIESIMSVCAESFFNQSVNTAEAIKTLADKFSRHGKFICAMCDSQIAGFVSFYDNDMDNLVGFLSMIIVRNQFQGNDIGSALVHQCVNECRMSGMRKLRLEVSPDNKKAIAFYEKMGFEQADKNQTSIFLEKVIVT